MSYTVKEDDGAVALRVEVLDGTLATDIVVLLRITDGSAVCKSIKYHLAYYVQQKKDMHVVEFQPPVHQQSS